MKTEIVWYLFTEISMLFSVRQVKIRREGQTIFKARVLSQNITCHAQLSLRFYGQCHGTSKGPWIEIGCNSPVLIYSRLSLTRTFKENWKRFELSGVPFIGSWVQMTANKEKKSLFNVFPFKRRGEWLWNFTKVFFVCFCSLVWPWPCTEHNSCLLRTEELTNRNVLVA